MAGAIEYTLDSCILADNTVNHFCAFITCENKEYCFDGASYRRLSPFEWKDKLNENVNIKFKKDAELKKQFDNKFNQTWNFTIGFQMLFYYRTK